MAAEPFTMPARATDLNNNVYPGAKLYFYDKGTLTPRAVYSDSTLATSLGAVVTADSGGLFPNIFLDNSFLYRCICKNATGSVTIFDRDPANSSEEYLASGTGAVARTVEAKLRDTVSVKDFGAVGDGVTDDSAEITLALQSGAKAIYLPTGTYAVSSPVTATLANDVTMFGPGKVLYTGASSTGNIMFVQCAGFSFAIEGVEFDGANLIAGGPRIENQAAMSNTAGAVCRFEYNKVSNFRMNAAALYNDGAVIRGSFEHVVIRGNVVRNITRAAGTGTPGSTGTSGITVSPYAVNKFIRLCTHEGNSYYNIIGDDLLASANNVDYDGFRFFAPDPTNFPNSDATVYGYGGATCVSNGNSYRNCRGRAIKVQGVASVRDEKIIRDADYTIYGGSSEINLQYGVGSVSDCEFYYNDYLVSSTVTSPIQSALTLVDFYQGAWYNEASAGPTVRGLQIYNAVKTGVGVNISAIVGLSGGVGTKDRPLIQLSDITMNRGQVDWIVVTAFTTGGYAILRMDGIVVPAVTYSAIGTDDSNINVEIIATGVVNLAGVKASGNRKVFISDVSPAGGNKAWEGKLTGTANRGWLQNYNVGADYNAAPMLNGGALADPYGATGGAASVQSAYLADDASYTFERRFFSSGKGIVLISVDGDYTSQGVFALGSGQVHLIAGHASNTFAPSTTGSNLDTDGKFNVWFSGDELRVKNRLGTTNSVTVMFIG